MRSWGCSLPLGGTVLPGLLAAVQGCGVLGTAVLVCCCLPPPPAYFLLHQPAFVK